MVWASFSMVSTARPRATQRPVHNHRSQHEDHHPCCLEHNHKKDHEKEQRKTTFQIFLQIASRRSIAVEVRPSTTIGHVKRMVEDAEGIPADALRVVYEGKQREDDDTVASLNIKQEVTVHVTCRLRGGMHSQTMNSIPLKHVPRAISGLLDEYHRTQHNKEVTKTVWRDLTSSDLQAVVRAVGPHSATAYKIARVSELFSAEDPDVALSYRWSATLGDIYDGLCTTCSPDETVWIDILFNAQDADLTPEVLLELTPKRYQNARRHLLLVTSTQDLVVLLTRGWICFEIAVRMISDKPMVELVDPHRKASELYQSGGISRDFFEAMETFDPRDTILIQHAIRQLFTRSDDLYLTDADPVLNFNRGVRDFVHLTGGKLFIADLVNQAGNVQTVSDVDPGDPLGQGHPALVSRLLSFYAVHTPREAIQTVKVKCEALLDKLDEVDEGWFGEKPMLREWLQEGDGMFGEKELLRQWSLTRTWLDVGDDEERLNRWLAAEVGSNLSELGLTKRTDQLIFFHSCATPAEEVGQILRACKVTDAPNLVAVKART